MGPRKLTGQKKGIPVTRRASGRHRSHPDPLAAAVGARIDRLRREQGFTFDAFVEEIGLGRGYTSELTRGLVVPSLTALKKVAVALDLTVADLVVGDSPREQLFSAARALSKSEIGRLLEDARGRARVLKR